MMEARSLWELVERRAEATPDKTMALDEEGRTLTFAKYRRESETAAAGLAGIGVGDGTVVSWQLPTWIEPAVLVGALARLGAVHAIGPAAATRITATMPNAPAVVEPDEVPEDEWNPMDPAVSSPVVAWLASDESQLVTGQVIRAVGENIVWMKGWSDGPTINNGGKGWDATTLGQRLATDVFGTRAPGLRY